MTNKVKRNILLNPGPATTSDTVKRAMVVADICPRKNDFIKLMAMIRQQLVRVVKGGEDYSCVLFAGSGTAGVEACINSVVPRGKRSLLLTMAPTAKEWLKSLRHTGLGI